MASARRSTKSSSSQAGANECQMRNAAAPGGSSNGGWAADQQALVELRCRAASGNMSRFAGLYPCVKREDMMCLNAEVSADTSNADGKKGSSIRSKGASAFMSSSCQEPC